MRALSVAMMVPLAGCAFMTTRPPRVSGHGRPVCSTNPRPARLDVALGTVLGLIGIVGGLKLADYHEPAGHSVLVSGFGTLAGFYASATVGYVRARRCRDAISEYTFNGGS